MRTEKNGRDQLSVLISRFLSGEASSKDKAQLSEYLNKNPECAHELVKQSHAEVLLREASAVETRQSAFALAAYRSKRTRLRLTAMLSLAAAFVLMASMLLYTFGTATPPDESIKTVYATKNATVTSADAPVRVILPDESILIMGPDTGINFTALNAKDGTQINQVKGKVLFKLKKQNQTFASHYKQVGIHVKGTVYVTEAIGENTLKTTLYEGAIRVEKPNAKLTLHAPLAFTTNSTNDFLHLTLRTQLKKSIDWLPHETWTLDPIPPHQWEKPYSFEQIGAYAGDFELFTPHPSPNTVIAYRRDKGPQRAMLSFIDLTPENLTVKKGGLDTAFFSVLLDPDDIKNGNLHIGPIIGNDYMAGTSVTVDTDALSSLQPKSNHAIPIRLIVHHYHNPDENTMRIHLRLKMTAPDKTIHLSEPNVFTYKGNLPSIRIGIGSENLPFKVIFSPDMQSMHKNSQPITQPLK